MLLVVGSENPTQYKSEILHKLVLRVAILEPSGKTQVRARELGRVANGEDVYYCIPTFGYKPG